MVVRGSWRIDNTSVCSRCFCRTIRVLQILTEHQVGSRHVAINPTLDQLPTNTVELLSQGSEFMAIEPKAKLGEVNYRSKGSAGIDRPERSPRSVDPGLRTSQESAVSLRNSRRHCRI